MNHKTHEFALYVKGIATKIDTIPVNAHYQFTDDELYHRIAHILRLSIGDICVFFDHAVHMRFEIIEYKYKKQIYGIIRGKERNKTVEPKITVLLPLLKRDDFEQALYNLTAAGATIIHCIKTEKSASNAKHNTADRMHRIIIAAAEQSKNFSFPQLIESQSLYEALTKYSTASESKIFFDPAGQPAADVMHMLINKQHKEIVLLVGPEGDLTTAEKTTIHEHGFIFCALTSTILRSVHASFLGLGMVRSIIRTT